MIGSKRGCSGLVAAVCLLGAACLGGCAPAGRNLNLAERPKPVENIDRIMLRSKAAAVNYDRIPGADGVSIQVYLFRLDRPEPVTVSGSMDILLYEGTVNIAQAHSREPFHIWKFDNEMLSMFLGRSLIGWGYGMDLRWPGKAPRSATVSVAARYRCPDGRTVYSEPVAIPMGQPRKRAQTRPK